MSIQFSVRYLLRTGLLNSLKEIADPIILLDWKDEELKAELEAAGAEVHPMLAAERSREYQRVRSFINVWHKRCLNSSSEAIWERRADLHRDFSYRVRRRVRKQIFSAIFALPKTVSWLKRKEASMFWTDTNIGAVCQQMDALRPDAVFTLTPYQSNEEMALRACVQRKIPICASILSFDNITTQGWTALRCDQYLVWNQYNAAELLRAYPAVEGRPVKIVGSPQFDFYWDESYRWTEAEWRERIGLPAGRRVILFGGGHFFCAPHEPRFLLQLDDAIENGELPRDTIILFRCHPVDPIERWLPTLSQTKHVIRDDPWERGVISGHANVRTYDIQKLASTLYYSAVHINTASTMAVDGAIADRPQIGPAYDDSPGGRFDRTARELYLQEHYLPITNSGGIDIVHSRKAFIAAVRDALDNPGRRTEGRARIVKEICTYADGRCTGRVLDAVRSFLQKPAGNGGSVQSASRQTVLSQ